MGLFNQSKCKVLHTDIIATKCFDYTFNDNYLKISGQEKDFVIFTSNTLLWTDQISSSVSKANKLICWITRNLINKDRSVILPVYKTLIRPYLEYCVQLWNPVPEHDNCSLILKLEGVQSRFTRMGDGVGY